MRYVHQRRNLIKVAVLLVVCVVNYAVLMVQEKTPTRSKTSQFKHGGKGIINSQVNHSYQHILGHGRHLLNADDDDDDDRDPIVRCLMSISM